MVDHRDLIVLHGLGTKVTPLIYVLIMFSFVAFFTRPFVSFLDPANVFYAYGFFLSAGAFFYEGILSIPESVKSTTGSRFGGWILGGLGVVSTVFGLATFFGFYDVTHDTTITNTILMVIMLFQIGVFVAQGWEEIAHYRRYKFKILNYFG